MNTFINLLDVIIISLLIILGILILYWLFCLLIDYLKMVISFIRK